MALAICFARLRSSKTRRIFGRTGSLCTMYAADRTRRRRQPRLSWNEWRILIPEERRHQPNKIFLYCFGRNPKFVLELCLRGNSALRKGYFFFTMTVAGPNKNAWNYKYQRPERNALSLGCNLLRLIFLLISCGTLVEAYQISPGTGLRSKDSRVKIVIFEHTEFGTGGLVLNCPTPICIGQLPIPRFQPFKELPLMLGSGLDDEDEGEGEGEDEECSMDWNNIAIGEVSPWFWLHNLDDIPGSFALTGAAGTLYMGGNIEEATKRLEEENISPIGRFKFFRQYRHWQAGELEQELQRGKWVAMELDPKRALETTLPGIRFP